MSILVLIVIVAVLVILGAAVFAAFTVWSNSSKGERERRP